MFSCEYCEMYKNSYFHRTPPVAASVEYIFGTFSHFISPLSANITKWSNTLKQFLGNDDELFEFVWPFYAIGA